MRRRRVLRKFPSGFYRHDLDRNRETERAVCVSQKERRPIYLPKSQLQFVDTLYGEEIYLPQWLLTKVLERRVK